MVDAPNWDPVSSIIINPSNTSEIYAGTENKGIYKSTNAGDSWTQINSGLIVLDIRELVMHPTNPNFIYAGTNGGGVFKLNSPDTTWTQISNGLTNWNINSLSINSTNPSIIYAGTVDGTGIFFKSVNGGENWIVSNNGLPTNADVQDIEIDPDDSEILYLSTQSNGIFISTNEGGSWIADNNQLPDQNILCLGKRPEGLYAGSRSKGLLLGNIFLIKNTETTNITCVGDNDGSITVNIFGGSSPYQYSIDSAITFQSDSIFTDLSPGDYQIVVKDANETTVSWDATIVLTEPETINLGDDITACEGEIITLDAGSFETYLWSDESTKQILSVTTTGTYNVTVTDENSCVSNDEIIVTFNTLPTAEFTTDIDNLTVTFSNTSENASSYLWDFGDGNTSTETNPEHTYTNAGNYQVELTSTSDNCGNATDIQTIDITTSINDLEFKNFVTIIPNPSNGLITLEINNSITDEILIEIAGINGQVVYKKQFNSNNLIEKVDLSENAKGIYFVRVKTKDFEKIGKLIIE
ncbi:hypothetical protein ES705_42242 [subsurface metagenome]